MPWTLNATGYGGTGGNGPQITVATASIVTLGQLFVYSLILTFEELIDQYNLNSDQFLTQVAVVVNIHNSGVLHTSEPIKVQTLTTLLTWSSKHHITTNIYCAITAPRQPILPKLHAHHITRH